MQSNWIRVFGMIVALALNGSADAARVLFLSSSDRPEWRATVSYYKDGVLVGSHAGPAGSPSIFARRIDTADFASLVQAAAPTLDLVGYNTGLRRSFFVTDEFMVDEFKLSTRFSGRATAPHARVEIWSPFDRDTVRAFEGFDGPRPGVVPATVENLIVLPVTQRSFDRFTFDLVSPGTSETFTLGTKAAHGATFRVDLTYEYDPFRLRFVARVPEPANACLLGPVLVALASYRHRSDSLLSLQGH